MKKFKEFINESKKIYLGFSEEVSNDKDLQGYIKNENPFGWVGHSIHSESLDELLEKAIKKTKIDPPVNAHDIALFATSTFGRHFGDSVEGVMYEAAKKYFEKLDSTKEFAFAIEKLRKEEE